MEWCIFRCYSLNAGRLFVHYYSYYYSFACNVLCTISNSQSDKQYRMLVCKFVLAHFCLSAQPCALIYLVKFHSTAFLSPWPFVIRPFVRFPPSFLSSFIPPEFVSVSRLSFSLGVSWITFPLLRTSMYNNFEWIFLTVFSNWLKKCFQVMRIRLLFIQTLWREICTNGHLFLERLRFKETQI